MRARLILALILVGASASFGAASWRLLPGQARTPREIESAALPQIYNGIPTSSYPAVAGLAIVNADASIGGCTGTLVSPSVVLTAAHCVDENPAAIGAVFFPGGSTRLTVVVVAYDIHPSYSPFTLAFADVAVLLLAPEPVGVVAPMPLASRSPHAGMKGTIVGYGLDEFEHFGLKQTGTVKLKRCPRSLPAAGLRVGQLSASLCWRATRHGQDTCQGDSGGPFIVRFAVAGVTSGGYPSCPGVLSWDTNVVPFLSWIRSHLI